MQHFQAKSLVWEVLGLWFFILFANFLHVFFMMLSERHVCSILMDPGLQEGDQFLQILQISHEKSMLKLRLEN